jgi:hypothetical protein
MDIGSSTSGRYDTGDERVDRALGRLADLDTADVSAHPPIYDDVQRSLAAVLDDTPAVPAEQ